MEIPPELAIYEQRIEDLRSQVSGLIARLSAEALNWQPIAGGGEARTNSLAVLATHVAGAEHFWIGEVVGGHSLTRDRDSEFSVEVTGPSELLELLERTRVETREVLSSLGAEDLEGVREARNRIIPVRWCLVHVVDHTALHLGHMQLTRQLWSRGQSNPSPRWFERLDGGH